MNHRWSSWNEKLAIFEGGTAAAPVRITFRSPDAANLNIVVERQREPFRL